MEKIRKLLREHKNTDGGGDEKMFFLPCVSSDAFDYFYLKSLRVEVSFWIGFMH